MRLLTVTPNPALDLTVQAPSWQRGEVNAARSTQPDAGGKGINVAALLADWIALGGWQAQVQATGVLGADNAGPFEALLHSKGVEDQFLRQPGSTRLGLKIVDPHTAETTDFNLPGAQVSAQVAADLTERVRQLAEGASAVVLAGSLPPGLPAHFYAGQVAALRAAGVPLLAADTSGVALRALLEAPALPHILKPNIHELEGALERPLPRVADALAAARALLPRGAEWVALSLGERGAWLVTAEGAVHAQPPSVQVVSTVGAGDAMVAGLVAARLQGLGPAEALRRATAFSAGKITRLGAHLPDAETLRTLERQVTLRGPEEEEL